VNETHPPYRLRSTVLAAALDRRPAGFPDPEALPAAAGPFGAEVGKLDTLLREVTAKQWRTKVLGELTTQRLVEHLNGHDAMLAAALHLDTPAARANRAHQTWRDLAFGLLRHAVQAPLTDRVEVGGLLMPVRNAYLSRAFETWIHADDIRLAIGRPTDPPCPEHLRALADLHIRSLPAALRLSGRPRPDRTAQVRLTGAFTQEWHIPLSRDAVAEPAVTLTADALEFCYLAANRRAPGTVPITVTGDHAIAGDLLAVMTYFSDE
jgi:uncharacterized protein (TIGR03083 family)